MISLRDYLRDSQKSGSADIWARFQQGCRRVLYALPTSGRKTRIFVAFTSWLAASGYRIVSVLHRQELIDQTCEALAAVGVTFGIIAAGFEENPVALVQVAMAQTLARRLDRLKGVQLLVIDEAHHAVAPTWLAILNAAPNACVLGSRQRPND
jgi:superfamily II DNA or RNA helicase